MAGFPRVGEEGRGVVGVGVGWNVCEMDVWQLGDCSCLACMHNKSLHCYVRLGLLNDVANFANHAPSKSALA